MSDISNNYRLDVEVLSPLHIGSGVTLRRGFEYMTQGPTTYRLNDRAILDERWPDDETEQRKLLAGQLADLLVGVDLAKHPEYVLYRYRGVPTLGEIREHIRDVYGQPYLPGSSLKGALRTAITRTIIEGVDKVVLKRSDIGPAMRDERDTRAAKQADDRIEARFAGADPYHDLFRALAVGDSEPAPADALTLQKIQVVPGLEVDVEALRAGTHLCVPLRVDTYLLKKVGEQLGFQKGAISAVGAFVKAVQFTSADRIRQEMRYHVARAQVHPLGFYQQLKLMMEQPGFDKTSCLVQVGFATGWRSKSVLGNLGNTDPLLEQVVHDFHLDRGGNDAAGGYESGQDFPVARHLAYRGDTPAEPLGWLKLSATRL